MITATVNVPVSAAELAEARAKEMADNEKRARESLAKKNRDAGMPEPKAGAKLYVATARGIKNRSRAGLLFSEQPAEVAVIEGTDAEVAEKQRAGAYVVNAYGAEQILDDSNGPGKGLTMWPSKPGDTTTTLADASTDALEAELARRKAAPPGGGEARITSHARTRGEK